jgi:hypothetical protein
VHLSASAAAALLGVAGPLFYASVAPAELRLVATAAGLLALTVVVLWHGRFLRRDVERVRVAFSEASSRAIA